MYLTNKDRHESESMGSVWEASDFESRTTFDVVVGRFRNVDSEGDSSSIASVMKGKMSEMHLTKLTSFQTPEQHGICDGGFGGYGKGERW